MLARQESPPGETEWQEVSRRLRERIGQSFDLLFPSAQYEKTENGVVYLSVATAFQRTSIVRSPYLGDLCELWRRENKSITRVVVSRRNGLHKQSARVPAPNPPAVLQAPKSAVPQLPPPPLPRLAPAIPPRGFEHLVSSWGSYQPPPPPIAAPAVQDDTGPQQAENTEGDAAAALSPAASPDPVARPLRVEDVMRVVCEHYGVSRADLVSSKRTRNISTPRQIAMYLSKTLMPKKSLPEIGRRFGGRDHTTVLHAMRRIEAAMLIDTALQAEIELLKRKIERSVGLENESGTP